MGWDTTKNNGPAKKDAKDRVVYNQETESKLKGLESMGMEDTPVQKLAAAAHDFGVKAIETLDKAGVELAHKATRKDGTEFMGLDNITVALSDKMTAKRNDNGDVVRDAQGKVEYEPVKNGKATVQEASITVGHGDYSIIMKMNEDGTLAKDKDGNDRIQFGYKTDEDIKTKDGKTFKKTAYLNVDFGLNAKAEKVPAELKAAVRQWKADGLVNFTEKEMPERTQGKSDDTAFAYSCKINNRMTEAGAKVEVPVKEKDEATGKWVDTGKKKTVNDVYAKSEKDKNGKDRVVVRSHSVPDIAVTLSVTDKGNNFADVTDWSRNAEGNVYQKGDTPMRLGTEKDGKVFIDSMDTIKGLPIPEDMKAVLADFRFGVNYGIGLPETEAKPAAADKAREIADPVAEENDMVQDGDGFGQDIDEELPFN